MLVVRSASSASVASPASQYRFAFAPVACQIQLLNSSLTGSLEIADAETVSVPQIRPDTSVAANSPTWKTSSACPHRQVATASFGANLGDSA